MTSDRPKHARPQHARLKRARHLAAGLVVLVLLAVVLWPSAQLVDSGTAERGEVRETLEAEGRTRLRERYVIAAPVGASARRMTLVPGDRVEAGQTLVVLDAGSAAPLDARTRAATEAWVAGARASLDAAREDAAAAEAAAHQASAEAARLRVLAQDRLVAAETAERAETARQRSAREAASARHRQATAEHQMHAAEAMLARGQLDGDAEFELVAPVDGVVLRRHYESARPVQAGEPLIEIGDPAALEVEVDVLSADAVRLREGMRVELLRWGEDAALTGTVRRVEPGGFTRTSALGVEEQRAWVIVELTGDPQTWQHLGEAYRVNARFVLREREDALRAPASAVLRAGDGAAVFLIDGRRARLTPVTIGLQGGGWVEILDGLQASDRVVVHPDNALDDGDRVRPR
ncbi:efflux RND transporter periplasmic adaptor subunit [Luteimonas sp. BDR2-5]|uniref:efflux RND transporter periplasmic adaptor subunit n=1 Tax=Proluteimonas luteida TaxID=2878685 RepID=UPI001E5C5DFE|nr:efflux RND transporter periplasmic adaptor subunit [Luteimonas sp. BDR2-5]MCD9027415.1 efflux RND transporter periplasmic adaptor subunit [Luteimonas sp. BDR2-5]